MSSKNYVHPTGEAIDLGKIVVVDTTGAGDFRTIADATEYLDTFKTGRASIIGLVGGQTHIVSSEINLRGITVIQVGPGIPIIQAATGAKLHVSGAQFNGIQFDVPIGFGGTYLMDRTLGKIVNFYNCDFSPATGKYISGSSAAPGTLNIQFFYQLCGQSLQQGGILDPGSISAYASYTITIVGTSGTGSLQFNIHNVTSDLEARYDVTPYSLSGGLITGLPEGELTVAPGESIQARLDSLVAIGGGSCKILPGIHITDTNIKILGDNIFVSGDGDVSVIRTVADIDWLGTTGDNDGVIMVGDPTGDIIVNGVQVQEIKLEQLTTGPHGYAIHGGKDNKFHQCTAEAQSDMTFASTAKHWSGFWLTDSDSDALWRPIIRYCSIQQSGTGNMYAEGIHIDGDSVVFYGNGNLVYDSIAMMNTINTIDETAIFEAGGLSGTVYANKILNCPQDDDGTAIVIAILGCKGIQVIDNNINDSPYDSSGASDPFVIWFEGSIRCLAVGNEINGKLHGGANNFGTGVTLNNGLFGFSQLTDQNMVVQNSFANCNYGITLSTLTTDKPKQNTINPNDFDPIGGTVTTPITDGGTENLYVGVNRYGAAPPGLLFGFFGDTYTDATGPTVYKQVAYPSGSTWVII